MPEKENQGLLLNTAKFLLAFSSSIVLFSLFLILFTFITSYSLKELGFIQNVIDWPQWQKLSVGGVTTFVVVLLALFLSEEWFDKNIQAFEKAIGKNVLLVLSFLLLSSVLIAVYFGFFIYLGFIYRTFWI